MSNYCFNNKINEQKNEINMTIISPLKDDAIENFLVQ